jgi:putative SOS response-associated peptidase YedK
MCGRYRLSRRAQYLRDHYGIEDDVDWAPRYNIAPTQPVAAVRVNSDRQRTFSHLRWGLIPSWAADPSVAARMINARAETAATKPAFSEPLRQQRCLIPADGFYEWQRQGGVRQPFYITAANDEPFAFAGLWDTWTAPDGRRVETCTILTTNANTLVAPVHDRMPVILPPAAYDRWLDPGLSDVVTLSALLTPYDADRMHCFPVSTRVNNVANDDEEVSLSVPLPAHAGQMTMF